MVYEHDDSSRSYTIFLYSGEILVCVTICLLVVWCIWWCQYKTFGFLWDFFLKIL